RLDQGPTRRGNFENARVVESMQAGVELRISPNRFEFRRAGRVSVSGFLEVDSALNCGNSVSPFVRFAIAGPGHVENLFKALPILAPAFDNLDAIKIGGTWILHRPNYESWARSFSACRHGRQIASHWNATGVGFFYPIAGLN